MCSCRRRAARIERPAASESSGCGRQGCRLQQCCQSLERNSLLAPASQPAQTVGRPAEVTRRAAFGGRQGSKTLLDYINGKDGNGNTISRLAAKATCKVSRAPVAPPSSSSTRFNSTRLDSNPIKSAPLYSTRPRPRPRPRLRANANACDVHPGLQLPKAPTPNQTGPELTCFLISQNHPNLLHSPPPPPNWRPSPN